MHIVASALIMMYKVVAEGDHNSNMSGLWFGHNLHGYNSLSTGSRLRETTVARSNDYAAWVYFKLPGFTHPSPFVNMQFWFFNAPWRGYADGNHCCSPPTHLKWFLYHTNISHKESIQVPFINPWKSTKPNARFIDETNWFLYLFATKYGVLGIFVVWKT